MTTRRPPVRRKPWGDRSWDSARALAPQPVDPAALAAALAASGYRAYRVHVRAEQRPRGVVYLAYFLVEHYQGRLACAHDVTARSRAAAKRLAIQEHKERCL